MLSGIQSMVNWLQENSSVWKYVSEQRQFMAAVKESKGRVSDSNRCGIAPEINSLTHPDTPGGVHY